ncbi:MAG: YopX family protein [Thiohalomonadaceae bacterium]
MREILFRGKDIAGNWYAGNLSVVKEDMHNGAGTIKAGSYISNEYGMPFAYQVRPETIGQFTGLVDKNGNKIFEGDIISTDLARDFLVVEFKGGAFVFNCNDGEDDYYDHINASHELDNEYKYGQIIGNIHDNPRD